MVGKHDDLGSLVGITDRDVVMGMGVFKEAERTHNKRAKVHPLRVLRRRVPQWPSVLVERTGKHIGPVISIGVAGGVSNRDLDRLHGLEHGGVLFSAVVQRPNILTNFGVQ